MRRATSPWQGLSWRSRVVSAGRGVRCWIAPVRWLLPNARCLRGGGRTREGRSPTSSFPFKSRWVSFAGNETVVRLPVRWLWARERYSSGGGSSSSSKFPSNPHPLSPRWVRPEGRYPAWNSPEMSRFSLRSRWVRVSGR